MPRPGFGSDGVERRHPQGCRDTEECGETMLPAGMKDPPFLATQRGEWIAAVGRFCDEFSELQSCLEGMCRSNGSTTSEAPTASPALLWRKRVRTYFEGRQG